jgi:hypothetical protein
MKFLTFNIVVAAALVYLFTGGGWSFQKMKETVFTESFAPEKTAPKPIQKVVAQKSEPKTVAPPVVEKTSPLITATMKRTENRPPLKSPRPLSPKIIARRDEVLASRTTDKHTVSNTDLMTREERRQSLLSIAEDMELFSVEAALR